MRVENVAGYDTVILAFTNWWTTMPILCSSYVDHFVIDDFPRTGRDVVHQTRPAHLVFGLQLFRNAVLGRHVFYQPREQGLGPVR